MEFHSAQIVKKCIEGLMCEEFNNYFILKNHNKCTRNNGYLLTIPKVKLELSNSGFFSMGVKNFNALPIEIRKATTVHNYRKLCKTHYML